MSEPPVGDVDQDDLARRCVAAMYERDRASRHLGITIEDVRSGGATVSMRVTEVMVNGHGIGHGGYVFLLADSAFAFACNTYDVVTVAAAAEIVFTAPVRLDDTLTARATERTRFGRSGIYDITVTRHDGTVVAEFRGHSRSRGERILGS